MKKTEKLASFSDPKATLQAAIEKLELFAKQDGIDLDVEESGHLIAAKATPLERILGRARCFIASIFSEQIRREQEEKFCQIKQEILQAKDIAKSHLYLIEKLRQGDFSQQKFAQWALETIQTYNQTVSQPEQTARWVAKGAVYIKDQLLLDKEIKGQEIELPQTVSIRYESHPGHPAQKTLKELSEIFSQNKEKTFASVSPTHKKDRQVMMDAFRMKGIRLIQTHLAQQVFMHEVLRLVKQTPIEIEEESASLVSMKQVLLVAPGATIILTGSFERQSADSKLMSIPILQKEGLRLTSEFIHTGFPYPSQHTGGWTLADPLIDARPLRSEQVPLFQEIEQRRRRLAQALLFDSHMMAKAKKLSIRTKEQFEQNPSSFIPLHRQLHEALIEASGFENPAINQVLHAFYEELENVPCAFDYLSQAQQKLVRLFIVQPAKKLEEQWLATGNPSLRIGKSQEKYALASQLMTDERQLAAKRLNPSHASDAFILHMGGLIGPAAQSLVLQHFSEKIGFAPPSLNLFERKIQLAAFQQLVQFLDYLEDKFIQPLQLYQKLSTDIHILISESLECLPFLTTKLVNELEIYFNSRFYMKNNN